MTPREIILWDALADLFFQLRADCPESISARLDDKLIAAQKVLAHFERNGEVKHD